MASPAMHLAIAKRYIEKHNNLNYKEFVKGTLYPDAEKNSIKLHYPKSSIMGEFAIGVYDKVDLYAFLADYPKLNDFELGWFLHLVTDYIFFEECFTEEYLLKNSYEEFCKDLYFAYDHLNIYLSEKYHIVKNDYKDYPSEYYPGKDYEKCILPKKMIDAFIKKVSSIVWNL